MHPDGVHRLQSEPTQTSCIYIVIYTYVCVGGRFMSVCTCVRMWVGRCVCVYACMCACMHACMHVHLHACTQVCMCACMRACVYACNYACMHDAFVQPELYTILIYRLKKRRHLNTWTSHWLQAGLLSSISDPLIWPSFSIP